MSFEVDLIAANNALVAMNVQKAIKDESAKRQSVVPAALLRKGNTPSQKADPVVDICKIHNPHKVHNRSIGEWRVEDDDGKVYGKHKTEAEADAQLAALYQAKEEE